MPVHKIIYRLDFEPNFKIIDSTGKIMQLLQEESDRKHWPDLGEIPDKHTVSGRNSSKEEGWWTSISIGPTALVGDFETLNGISIEQIEESKLFDRLFNVTNIMRREFQITSFKRIGFRLFLFEAIETDKETLISAFQSLFDRTFSDNLVDILGGYADYGIALDGHHDDGLQYHLKFGPYADGELKNRLVALRRMYVDPMKIEEQETPLSLTMDLDLYEENTRLAETTNFSKWCRPVLAKGSKTLEAILTNIMTKLGG